MSTIMGSRRTLRASGSAIPQLYGQPALVPIRLEGREAVNELFEYRLLLATPDELNPFPLGAANFALSDFNGREINLSIELDGQGTFIPASTGAVARAGLGAGTRQINALVAHTRLLGQQGRRMVYELTLRPWLHLATLRQNCRIFQNQTPIEVIDALLSDYHFPLERRLVERYHKRDYITQSNESDFSFFCRLCEEWGINYFFEHVGDAHRLVLADNMGAFRKAPSEAYQRLSIYTGGHKIDEEYIERFAPASALRSGAFSTQDYDYTRPRADLSAARRAPDAGAQPAQEVYEFHAGTNYAQPRAGAGQADNDPHSEGNQLAMLRMQALRTDSLRAEGFGHLRGLPAGCCFALQKHPQEAANTDWLVLSGEMLMEEIPEESGGGTDYRVDLHFDAHPMSQPLRPPRRTPRPVLHLESALVVGPEGQDLWTDSLGRIKVQFPWDREGQRNENSSCWLRVAQAWAGNQLGAGFIPRVGQEVLVGFISGDPDQPICTGSVNNQVNLPPLALAANQSISSIRSRERVDGMGNAAGGRSNLLALDDTAGHIQAQLQSDHARSRLSLGDIARIEGSTGRKEQRGEGFELSTEAHGNIRGESGMLISSEPGEGAIKSMAAALARLGVAKEQQQSMGHWARQAEVQADGAEGADVERALDAQHAEIRGDPARTFPELSKPHIVLASGAGIAATAVGSTHLHSGEHTALTSEGHTSVTTGKSLLASARDAIKLFAGKLGINMTAWSGNIYIRALRNGIQLLAHVDITLTADQITMRAKKRILMECDGAYWEMARGNMDIGLPGKFSVHSAGHAFDGPRSLAAASQDWPDASFDDRYVVRHPRTGEPMAGIRYSLQQEGMAPVEGVTDKLGRIALRQGMDPARVVIDLLGR